jgi:hypothetical protein
MRLFRKASEVRSLHAPEGDKTPDDYIVQLIKAVKEICEQSPEFVRVCGKRINARRYWLDLEFPARPPPEFERSG